MYDRIWQWKRKVALAAVGLVSLVVPLAAAQAREIYCASDEEVANLVGGFLDVIMGPRTQMVQDSSAADGHSSIVWAGQAQRCPATAKDSCQGRVDHAETVSYTHMVSVSVAGDLTGTGTSAHWLPILAVSTGYARTKATAFDVALTTSISPGETWQPVVEAGETSAHGHFVGGYHHVGEAAHCHQYALDPKMIFGQYEASLKDNPVSTWVRQ
ncbi:MAG TPA: hypothetical protein VI248_05395 [Kineosporiaceae bacterium]